HVTLLLDGRRRGLAINVTARLLAVDDDIVAGGMAHANRGAAAAANGHARAGALMHRRAAGPLRLVYRGAATGRLSGRGGAALALARAALLLARAGSAPLPRAGARPRLHAGIRRLRELEAAGRLIGRNRGSDSEGCRGPEHNCEYSHLFLLRGVPPRKAIR